MGFSSLYLLYKERSAGQAGMCLQHHSRQMETGKISCMLTWGGEEKKREGLLCGMALPTSMHGLSERTHLSGGYHFASPITLGKGGRTHMRLTLL